MMYYSQTTGGFYRDEIHGEGIPPDAVEVDAQTHAALMAAQSAGKVIASDAAGKPVAIDPPPPAPPTAMQRIANLEARQTPRRIREHALGEGGGWLKDLDAQIAALRAEP